MRWAALLLMNTVPLPTLAVHVLGPQHAMWMPVSSTRIAGSLFTLTSGEPMIAGPTAGCGHAGQPCASTGTLDLSPSRHWPGMWAPGVSLRAGEHGWVLDQTKPPGVIVPTPPRTGPTGTYGGAKVGTGPVPSTLVTIVLTFHRL